MLPELIHDILQFIPGKIIFEELSITSKFFNYFILTHKLFLPIMGITENFYIENT